MFAHVSDSIKDCGSTVASGDAAKLEKMGEIFKHPSQFIYHIGKDLIVNQADIKKNVEAALLHYEMSFYYKFGQDLGKAASLTLIGLEKKNLVGLNFKKFEQLTAGFLKGAADVENFKEIETCVSDIGIIGGHLESALKDFKSKQY